MNEVECRFDDGAIVPATFSINTKALDLEYLEAVEKNDMEKPSAW